MKTMWFTALSFLLPAAASSDELILKNGTSIHYRVLKDCADSVEVQTVDNRTVTIQKKDVKEIRLNIPKTPLSGAVFFGDETTSAEKSVNLLSLIDPKKHGTTGDWRFSAGALSGGGLLDVPYVPASPSYDVEITLERKDGVDEVNVGLVAQGTPFSFLIDWGKGSCSGISVVAGRRVFENDTKVMGKQLLPRKARRVVCAVRPKTIVILVDGKEFLRWEGDVKQLSIPSRTKEQNLFISTFESTIVVTRYVIVPRK